VSRLALTRQQQPPPPLPFTSNFSIMHPYPPRHHPSSSNIAAFHASTHAHIMAAHSTHARAAIPYEQQYHYHQYHQHQQHGEQRIAMRHSPQQRTMKAGHDGSYVGSASSAYYATLHTMTEGDIEEEDGGSTSDNSCPSPLHFSLPPLHREGSGLSVMSDEGEERMRSYTYSPTPSSGGEDGGGGNGDVQEGVGRSGSGAPSTSTPLLSSMHHPAPNPRMHLSPYMQMHMQMAGAFQVRTSSYIEQRGVNQPYVDAEEIDGEALSNERAQLLVTVNPVGNNMGASSAHSSSPSSALPSPASAGMVHASNVGGGSFTYANNNDPIIPGNGSNATHATAPHLAAATAGLHTLAHAPLGREAAAQQYGLMKKDDGYSRGMGMGMGSGGGGSIQSKSSQVTFYARQLNKLKAVGQSVHVRVKRAMSAVESGMAGAVGVGSGAGGTVASSSSSAATPLSSSSNTCSNICFIDRLRTSSIRRWKEFDAGLREKLLFLLSSLLGTCFFFVLFEALYRVCSYQLSVQEASNVFTLAYVCAYVVSIGYQHFLNRLLIFRFQSAPYCSSLMHTYFVYSISLCFLTIIGALLIRLAGVNPRLIACVTLPASGALNYYLLRVCIEGNMSMVASMSKSLTLGGAGSTVGELVERGMLVLEKYPLGGGSGSMAVAAVGSSVSRKGSAATDNPSNSTPHSHLRSDGGGAGGGGGGDGGGSGRPHSATIGHMKSSADTTTSQHPSSSSSPPTPGSAAAPLSAHHHKAGSVNMAGSSVAPQAYVQSQSHHVHVQHSATGRRYTVGSSATMPPKHPYTWQHALQTQMYGGHG